ncbi:MAG: pyridine nucleotide-disulfide oxidoreductase, partial [Gammaproteobacteria bacterium]
MEFSERVPPYPAAGVSASAQVNLALGFTAFAYADLYEPDRLRDLLAIFDDYVADRNPALSTEFGQYRTTLGEGLPPQTISDLLVRMAPYVGDFVAKLFGVASERDRQRAAIQEELDTVFVFRNKVLAQAQEKFRPEDLITWDVRQLQRQIEILKHIIAPGVHANDPERALAGVASELWTLRERCAARARDQEGTDTRLEQDMLAIRARIEADPEARATFADCLTETRPHAFVLLLLDRIERWSFAARHDAGINATVANWVSFKQPKKTDFQHLVHAERLQRDGYQVLSGPMARRRRRDGFALTDPRHDERHVLYEVDHCIYC